MKFYGNPSTSVKTSELNCLFCLTALLNLLQGAV